METLTPPSDLGQVSLANDIRDFLLFHQNEERTEIIFLKALVGIGTEMLDIVNSTMGESIIFIVSRRPHQDKYKECHLAVKSEIFFNALTHA